MSGPLGRLSPRAWKALNVLGLLVLIALVIPFVTAAFPGVVGAEQTYVVTSGSMEPAIGVGDMVYVYDVDPADIQEGDVITYDVDGDRQVTTHRVIDVLRTEEGRQFQTKGDANEDPDQYQVPPEAVVGRVGFSLPVIGRAVVFANSQLGILTLLIVPAALLILNEVYTLGRAYLAAQNNDDDDESGGDVTPDGESGSGSGGDD
jgi:signal peptidase